MVTHDQVISQLETVNDPHVPVSLRRMGMLRDISINADNAVTVDIAIPCLGCPAASLLAYQVQEAVSKINNVSTVQVNTLWGEKWQREDIDITAHPLLRQNGLQI